MKKTYKTFGGLLILPENYNFYTDFCTRISNNINFKKDQIIKYGKVIDIPKEYSNYLTLKTTTKKLSKIREVLSTLKEFIFGD